jgi:hypothetical protein
MLVGDRSAMTEMPRTQRRPQAKPIEHYRSTIADKKSAMADLFQCSLCNCKPGCKAKGKDVDA